jgi:hypothetical protein
VPNTTFSVYLLPPKNPSPSPVPSVTSAPSPSPTAPTVIRSASPSEGGLEGGTLITVLVSDFSGSPTRCRFSFHNGAGAREASGTWVTTSILTCVTPVSPPAANTPLIEASVSLVTGNSSSSVPAGSFMYVNYTQEVACPAASRLLCLHSGCQATVQECVAGSSCRNSSMFTCWDGSCAARQDDCLPIDACPMTLPYRCAGSGACAVAKASCPNVLNVCPEKQPVMCPDGSCSITPQLCPRFNGCPVDKPVMCPSGDCAETREDHCPKLNGALLCPDGTTLPAGKIACAKAPFFLTKVRPAAALASSADFLSMDVVTVAGAPAMKLTAAAGAFTSKGLASVQVDPVADSVLRLFTGPKGWVSPTSGLLSPVVRISASPAPAAGAWEHRVFLTIHGLDNSIVAPRCLAVVASDAWTCVADLPSSAWLTDAPFTVPITSPGTYSVIRKQGVVPPAPSPTATPSPTAKPSASASATATPTPSAKPAGKNNNNVVLIGVLGAVAAVGAIAAAVSIYLLSRRPSVPAGGKTPLLDSN